MESLTLQSVVSTSVKPLKEDIFVQEALVHMFDGGISSVVIVDEVNRPVGIFTEHDVLKIVTHVDPNRVHLSEVMSMGVLCVEQSMYLHDAYAIMEQKGYRHLIVTNDTGEYVGVVSEGDFLRHMGFEHLAKFKVVEDAMSETPLSVGVECTLSEAAALMRERHKEYVILMENGEPVGMVTEREIARVCVNTGGKSENSVMEIASKELRFISKSTPLHEAAAMMKEHGVHQLVVVDEKKNLIGMIDRHAILKALHGAYFEFLITIIDQKSEALEQAKAREAELKIEKEHVEAVSIKFRTLFATIPDLIWIKDTEGKYLACNPMFERLYGVKEELLLGKDDFEFVTPELAQFFRENDQKALEAGIPRHNEEYLVFADGSYEGMFDTIKTPMRDNSGAIIGVLGVARDISEKQKNDEELRRKGHDLSEAQSLAHIGSWRFDIHSNCLEWSDETYRIFGMEIGSSISYESFLLCIHSDDRAGVDRAWQKALLDGVNYEIEHRIIVNGTVKWVIEHAKLEVDTSGDLVRGVGSVQDITHHKLYAQQLEKMANYDVLTGLANRSFLLSNLQKTINKVTRKGGIVALLLFDLDRFKDVNDSFGHAAGDELLKQVSGRFRERLRDGDMIARLGGDEFAIVLDNLAYAEDAGAIADEMIVSLGKSYPLSDGIMVHIGASVGIVLAPTHGSEGLELLQFADAALYRAKEEGRGVYRYYTDDLTEAARKRIDCESQLRRAIENNEFEVYYQPQVHIGTGRIVGAEALVRWNDPVRGLISPALFIPLAEETGMIGIIGEWVLNQACIQGKKWLDSGYRLTLAVNLSAHQVRHQNVLKMVENALKMSGFAADRLELELTESALMDRQEEVIELLHSLRAHGVRLAIDDFGTGYSSLSYLKRFPIDVLKIDKSFVDDIPYDQDDMAIVTAIIAMGKALGFQVLAEGTERQEQVDYLREQGCTMYQGYIKSPPVPAAEFEKML